MIAIVSPAKSLDFETPYSGTFTTPRKLEKSAELIKVLRKKAPKEIGELMSISDKLSQLNVERYHAFERNHNLSNARPCIHAFQGDVYQGLGASSFEDTDIDFAQSHFRILSGLYGLLRPLDLIQPYRLEMGTKLGFDDHKTLYDFWSGQIAELINQDLRKQEDDILINLASQEYWKSVDRTTLKARVVDIEFKDLKGDQYKIISFYAKKARGLMSRYIIQHRLTNPEELKEFDLAGYFFDEEASTDNKLCFKRN